MGNTLTIFGINGRTGREIARIAIGEGWKVRGFARPKSQVQNNIDNLQIVRASYSDLDRIENTIADTEAVCCVIGPRPPYTEVFCAAATAVIIEAMNRTGCRRLICQTGAMIGSAPNRSTPMQWMARAFAIRRPEVARDRVEQERIVESSDLDWTIVKPPRLTNSPSRDQIEASPTLRVGLMSRICRVDLATFILNEVQTSRFERQRVFVKGRRLTGC